MLTIETVRSTKAWTFLNEAEKALLTGNEMVFLSLHIALDVIGEIGIERWASETKMSHEFMRIVRELHRNKQAEINAITNKETYGDIAPLALGEYAKGAVLVDTWGHEQTNKDFYCIVARKGDYITMLPMESTKGDETSFMSFNCVPTDIDYSATPIKKKIKCHKGTGEEVGFSLRQGIGGGWVQLWKGTPETASTYA